MVLWPQIVLAPPIAMMTEIMRFFVDVVITLSLRSCEGRTSFVICNRKLGVAWACVSNLRIEERIEAPRERLNKISDGPGRNCMRSSSVLPRFACEEHPTARVRC